MANRTPDNCRIINRHGEPGRSGNKCLGFGKSATDDEPCEACKRCRHNTTWEPEGYTDQSGLQSAT